MKNIKKLLIVESSIALVLLGFIAYLFIAGGMSLTGNVILTPNSGNDVAVEIIEPTPDQVFLYVVNMDPSDSSSNQGVYDNIIVTFSEQVFSSTVNSNTFILRGPNGVTFDGVITSDSTGRVLTFNPTSRLESNTQYTIIITTELEGISGNTLLTNYVSNFTTSYYSSGGGSSNSPSPLVLSEITLTPSSRSISTGNTFQLSAMGLDQNGNEFDTTINYISSNSSVANVSSSGLVNSLSVGNTTITAFNGFITDSSLVIVNEAALSSIEFSFTQKNISVGNDFELDGISYDQNGDPIVVAINYTSSNESVATINSTGFITVLLPGNTTITASNNGINDSFILNVFEATLTSINLTSPIESLALGNTTQLNATGWDQFNLPMDVIIGYVSNDSLVAIVNSTGFVNASGVGSVILTALNGTVNDSVTLTVYVPILTRIELTPSSVVLPLSSGKQLNATGFDQNNDTISVVIGYNSSNESVATINSTGFVSVIGAGNTTITAFNGSVNDTSLIEVFDLSLCPEVSVDLGTAGDFVILSETGISTTGTTSIVGNMGVSPIDHTAITGFSLMGVPSTDAFLTSSLVTGNIYAANLVDPTPSKMTTAIGDMETAYTTSNGLAACVTELGAGDIGGMTLSGGVYKWGSDLNIPTDVTLSGTATDVWVFQISGKLDIASATEVNLVGGALAENVYWIAGDVVTLGTTSVFNGNILAQTNIDMQTDSTLNGRALAQTAVTLDATAVSN